MVGGRAVEEAGGKIGTGRFDRELQQAGRNEVVEIEESVFPFKPIFEGSEDEGEVGEECFFFRKFLFDEEPVE